MAYICSAIGIALMIVLIADLGNYGVAVARLTGFATIFFSVFVVERWFFKKVQTRFWFSLIGTLALAATVAALVIILTRSPTPPARPWTEPSTVARTAFSAFDLAIDVRG